MSVRQCVILVGGLGTRLGELTKKIPKPLLPVGNRVFLDYVVAEVARHGFEEIVLLSAYRSDEIQNWAKSTQRRDLVLNVVTEPEPWGTAGALLAAKDVLDDEFLLLNGDSIFDINLLDLATSTPTQPWDAVVALRSVSDTGRYGTVQIDGDVITSFAERPEAGSRGLINGGIYRLARRVLDLVPSVPCSIERDVFPALAARGTLRGREYSGFFLDIGVPDALEAAQTLVPGLGHRPALFLDRDGVVNKEIGYAYRADQIEWTDGIFEAVKAVNDVGRYVFVVTNQAGVARGLYDEQAVISLHRWMAKEFRRCGSHVDEFAYCPHHPSVGRPPYLGACTCRKPAPGMMLALADRWGIDVSRSFLIGDKDSDLQAADAAGIPSELFSGGSILPMVKSWLQRTEHGGATRR